MERELANAGLIGDGPNRPNYGIGYPNPGYPNPGTDGGRSRSVSESVSSDWGGASEWGESASSVVGAEGEVVGAGEQPSEERWAGFLQNLETLTNKTRSKRIVLGGKVGGKEGGGGFYFGQEVVVVGRKVDWIKREEKAVEQRVSERHRGLSFFDRHG